jgi:hypothetical protein
MFIGRPEAGERSAVIFHPAGQLPAARHQSVQLFEGFVHAIASSKDHRNQIVYASGLDQSYVSA